MVVVLLSLSLGTYVTTGAQVPIEHIIVLYEENRSFDHYFGTYPGSNGLTPGTALPKAPGSKETVSPFHLSTTKTEDLGHSHRTARTAYNNGKMDRFVYAEKSDMTMGYYDYRDIPYYWDYASKFVLMDNFFTSEMGPSLPNHLYLIAGQSGGLTENAQNFSLDFRTVMDELDNRGISWKYYADGPKGYKEEGLWNPLPAFASFKNNPARLSNLAPNDQFLVDVAKGNFAKWPGSYLKAKKANILQAT